MRIPGPYGFTLLEIVVVLAIVGMVAAIATPAVLSSVEAWRRQADLDELYVAIRNWPSTAMESGARLDISTAAFEAGVLPVPDDAGWSLAADPAWRVHVNGYCEGGELQAARGDRTYRIIVDPPFCEPRQSEP